MDLLKQAPSGSKWIPRIARIGLISKGIIYCLIGIVAFMSAFKIGGESYTHTNKKGLMSLIQQQFAGQFLLALLILGLLCYCLWRGVQCFSDTENKGSNSKGFAKRGRYLLSGLIYLSFAIAAAQVLLHSGGNNGGNSNQKIIQELLAKPFGQYLAGTAAAIIAGVGIYQIIYGISGKYKKHVTGLHLHTNASAYLLKAGTIGYIARGIVWLIISWLMFKAAIHASAKDAGDTNQAFQFIEDSSYGPVLAGLLGLGLVLYGVFNFIRARFEHFKTA
ncbi:MAG: hypothetical protein JWR18_3015 [Segetibacter sp.]|nr:hypothetical protein [Segetibacter sp.]